MSQIEYKTKIDVNNKKILELRKLIIELEKENVILEKRKSEEVSKNNQIELNEQQKRAVEGSNSNSIIIACPGSGKTHTLIAKVIHLIKNKDVDPSRIIMITFTKKASQEMNDRLGKRLGFSKLLHIGTLHGLAYRTLQKYDKINYTIIDEKESHKAMQDVFQGILLKDKDHKIADST